MVTRSPAGRASGSVHCRSRQGVVAAKRTARFWSCDSYTTSTFKNICSVQTTFILSSHFRTFLKRINMTLRQCFVPMIHQYTQNKFRMSDLKLPPICNRAMRCFAASSGNLLPTFRDHNGPIFVGPDRLSRNVGKKLLLLAV